MIPVVFITSEKGGVGKSFITMATIEATLQRGLKVGFIEFDSVHPDVWQRYETVGNVHVTELARIDGSSIQLDLEAFIEALEDAYSYSPDVIIANTSTSAIPVLGEAFKALALNTSSANFAIFYILAEPFNDRTWSGWLTERLTQVPASQLFTIVPRWTLPYLRSTSDLDLQSQVKEILPKDTTIAVVDAFTTKTGRVPWNAPDRTYNTLQDLIAEGDNAPMPFLASCLNAQYLRRIIAQVSDWLAVVLPQPDLTALESDELSDEAF